MGVKIDITRKTFTVSAQALARVVGALNGPDHYIRELQAIRSLDRLPGHEPNPINVLTRQIKSQLAQAQPEHDLHLMRQLYHNRQLRVNPMDVDLLLDVVEQEAGIRLKHEQLVGILDLFPKAHVMLGIYGADTDPMAFTMDAVSQFFMGRNWPTFEEQQHDVPDEDKELLVDMDQFRDAIKKAAIELRFIG